MFKPPAHRNHRCWFRRIWYLYHLLRGFYIECDTLGKNKGELAQLVARGTLDPWVMGSSPSAASSIDLVIPLLPLSLGECILTIKSHPKLDEVLL